MKSGIALIGFMASGKTSVGKLLATRLGLEFIETDSLIAQRAGKPIPEIFRQDGEIAFRDLEIGVIKEVAARKNAVIAGGGGVVLNTINIDRLRQENTIIYLTASPAAVLRRTAGDTSRPLLMTDDREEKIRELMRRRRPFYEYAADITVNTSRKNVTSVADEIMRRLAA